uniref:E3 ubiquitin-protein ligase n=1 Tax=Pundamilia nyererei TaxID=303518 RepID=A0A3B4GHB1_9CICH
MTLDTVAPVKNRTLKLGVLNFTTGVLQYPQNLHFPQPFSLFALKFGLECGVCMREPQETVGLPCNHIYCLTCIKNSLDAGRTSCPKCRQQLPDDFQPHSNRKQNLCLNKQKFKVHKLKNTGSKTYKH